MSASQILNKYLSDLILELEKLKTILEFENEKINQGLIDILNLTNPQKELILNSIKNYYLTINSWLKIQGQIQEESEKLIEDATYLRGEICNIYQNEYTNLIALFEQKSRRPKIKFSKSLFKYNNPTLVDVKI
ncbi:hypothetical protein CR532_02875 [Candidatus Borreliella tachyglossi]|uniref:Uncharacterized protein n=1 Tax=Candidatus Borreliella tachyglossi TaxID=1964448 RepID=A0A2S1LXB4_9SPIR|nr:hypothetical protein [Candidatus Borreliella tachyglossi]AWG42916.1 hypothetical protein CR532_02875 [Candidatus Borreliella tachyglossi]